MRAQFLALPPILLATLCLLSPLPSAAGQSQPAAPWTIARPVDLPQQLNHPTAPDRLRAEGLPDGAIQLVWRDRSDNETGFEVELLSSRQLVREFAPLVTVDKNHDSLRIEEMPRDTSFLFRVRAINDAGASSWTPIAVASPLGLTPGVCNPDLPQLCLDGGRFRVEVRWRDPRTGDTGIGRPIPFGFSEKSGSFWFFDPDFVELVVKVLDGRSVNDFYWSFFGALSDVEYWVVVTDTVAGENRTYYNAPGDFCGFGDTRSLPRPPLPPPATTVEFEAEPEIPGIDNAGLSLPQGNPPTLHAGTCSPGPTTLCLLGSRFQVEVSWHDPRTGTSGLGHALPGTNESGFFWFFEAKNVELVVKLLDGLTVNGHFWFFHGGLSDVQYTITVTDTVEDETRRYFHPSGDVCGGADLMAF